MKAHRSIAALLSALMTAALLAAASMPTRAATNTIRIGFITDFSGELSDADGAGGLEAVRMAVEDFAHLVPGSHVEVLYADHQNKPDLAASKAREWIDRDGLDLLIGGTNSSTGLALNTISEAKKEVYINVGAGTDELTNADCQPYGVHYAYDTTALARGTVAALAAGDAGRRSWFFLTADYAFGHSLESAASRSVLLTGGKVVGAVRHPLGTPDFSSYLLTARSSGAQVLGLADAGADTSNAIKQANEFGLPKTMTIAPLLLFISEVHSLGLPLTQGMYVTDSWYWDQTDDSRRFAMRFFSRVQQMPTSLQAADYSAVATYLKAVAAAGTTDADPVMKTLKTMTIDDLYSHGHIRADGLMMHDMYLYQVKRPNESARPWDYYRLIRRIAGEDAFGKENESTCRLPSH